MYKMTAQDIHCIDDKTSKHYQASQITKDKGRHQQRDRWLLQNIF